jgi:hypothetical protein
VREYFPTSRTADNSAYTQCPGCGGGGGAKSKTLKVVWGLGTASTLPDIVHHAGRHEISAGFNS